METHGLSDHHIKKFQSIMDSSRVKTDPQSLESYGKDWTSVYPPNPAVIVFPKTTEEVSSILKYCHDHSLAVVPSGGRTGLAAAAVASDSEVVVSMEKMNQILKIDLAGMYIQVEAGVITQTVQETAAEKGVFFALDLAAKGSCQIGGNIATNAGGLKLIRYGGMREQVLGLEVVLSDGTVLNMDAPLHKNNTGYDLKHIFIGSEGTLGIITKATLRLNPAPKSLHLAALAVNKSADILKILERIHLAKSTITAFEFFADPALRLVCETQNKTSPFEAKHPYYLLLELEDESDSMDHFENILEELFNLDLIVDGVLATNQNEFHNLWSFRELISESMPLAGLVYKNDVSIPIEDLDKFLDQLEPILQSGKSLSNPIELIIFGHIGDGNVHLNYLGRNKSEPYEAFLKNAKAIESEVFKLLAHFKGSISAEHGIGLLKKAHLHISRTDREVEIMRQIKKILDPKGILNPGKIFD